MVRTGQGPSRSRMRVFAWPSWWRLWASATSVRLHPHSMDILAQASSTATSEVLRGLGSPFDEHRCGTTLRDGAKRRRHPKRGSACDDGNTGRAGRT